MSVSEKDNGLNLKNEEGASRFKSLFHNNSLKKFYNKSKMSENLDKILITNMEKQNNTEIKNVQSELQTLNIYEVKITEIQKELPQEPNVPSYENEDIKNMNLAFPSKDNISPEEKNNVKANSKSENSKQAFYSPNKFIRTLFGSMHKSKSDPCFKQESSILKKSKSENFHVQRFDLKAKFFQRNRINFESNFQNSGEGDEKVKQLLRFKNAENKKELELIKPNNTETKEEELRKAFEVYDPDGFGCISTKTLRQFMTTIGETLTEKEMEDMIQMVDVDGDGLVKCDQLVKMLS